MSEHEGSETSTTSSPRAPDAAQMLAHVLSMLAEARELRLARWDAEYPPGHADRPANRPRFDMPQG